MMVDYLAKRNHPGPKNIDFIGRWYDDLVEAINRKHPTIKIFDLRLKLQELLGNDETITLPSIRSIGRCLKRCKAKRKRCTFLSDAQDTVEVFDHMERMQGVEVDNIVNWDETSASFSKFRPIFGRGEGEIVMNEWRIGDKTYSAIAGCNHHFRLSSMH